MSQNQITISTVTPFPPWNQKTSPKYQIPFWNAYSPPLPLFSTTSYLSLLMSLLVCLVAFPKVLWKTDKIILVSPLHFYFCFHCLWDVIFNSLFLYRLVQSFMEVLPLPSLSFLEFTHSCWPPWLTYFLLTELFAVFIITLPAGLVGYLLQLLILLPNIINLFELIYSFPYFSNEPVISLPFSVDTSYPSPTLLTCFLFSVLSALILHLPALLVFA